VFDPKWPKNRRFFTFRALTENQKYKGLVCRLEGILQTHSSWGKQSIRGENKKKILQRLLRLIFRLWSVTLGPHFKVL
jgi:hypothetical protein